jgi:hypothetical protein
MILITQSQTNECFIDRGIGLSPDNKAIDINLPKAVDHENGVLLPKETSAALSKKLKCLWAWPDACQIVINTQKDILLSQIRGLEEINKEIINKAKDQNPYNTPIWVWPLVGGVGGCLAGFGLGFLVHSALD